MESIFKKGQAYVESFPRRRLLPTLLNFDVAVAAFLLLNVVLGIKHSKHDIILAFTGWTSLGNSNWYIFVILLCYLCTYIGFYLVYHKRLLKNRVSFNYSARNGSICYIKDDKTELVV